MESISSDKREVLLDTLLQVKEAIENLLTWNKGIVDMNQLLLSPSGTQALAGNCMTIMAVAEGFRKIDKATDGQFLPLRPEIPWRQVFGLRNRIAHGYFDIDVDIISEVINNDLQPLLQATSFFISYLKASDE
ncbi:MAG: DUF86 domain-containing protein [Bacteroidaceae bacterium]|nr:DUF86 domain-containing protein [Bacteroidaceae bacterium]